MLANGEHHAAASTRRAVASPLGAAARHALQLPAPSELLRLGRAAARHALRRAQGRGGRPAGAHDARSAHAVRALEPSIASVLREKTDPAAALVAIDPRTGAVKAMMTYLPDGRQLKFNLASQAAPQAGSAFKPFVLATAIDQGISVYTGFSGRRR